MTPEMLLEYYAISIADAAEHLLFSETTIYELISSKQLFTFKVGRKQFITRSSLDALIIKRWPENHNPELTARLIGLWYERLAAEDKLKTAALVPTSEHRTGPLSSMERPRTPKT